MSKSDLTIGPINNHIKRIALPASTGMFFNTLFNVVDTIFAGRIGTNALAGLSLSFPVFFIIISISYGVGTGSTALISNALGRKDERAFHTYCYNAFYLGFILSVILTLLGRFVIAKPMFELMGAKGLTLQFGLNYTNTIFLGSVFFIMNITINAILSSQGDTVSYRNVLISAFVLNVFLDPLFILGWFNMPKLGTMGIALATVIVQIIATVYLVRRLIKSEKFDLKEFKKCKLDFKIWDEILKQGIPASLNMMTIALGVFVINYFVLKYSNDTTIAAYGASMRIEQIALLPALGLNTATLTIVGQNYGAKKYERILRTYKSCLKYGVTIMTVGMIMIYPMAGILIKIFNSDFNVIKEGTRYLRIEFLCFNSYVLMNLSISLLQGLKKPKIAIYIGLYRQLIMPFIVFNFLGTTLNMGVSGVWWGIVLINWSAAIIILGYTFKMFKELKKELEVNLEYI